MDRIEADVVVAGGGVAGLAATAVFAQAGFTTVCVEPVSPVTDEAAAGADLRSTAFLEPSIDLLRDAGLWPRIAPHATDLAIMRIVDAGGPEPVVRQTADFDAAALDRPRFGANAPNWVLRREMLAGLAQNPNATLLTGVRVVRATPRTDAMILALSDGRHLRCRLAVAADGRDSFLRGAAGIGVRKWGYGQKALVFAVRHALPHRNVSTEVHRTGGPFTLVPLPDRDGVPHSAVVWMDTGPRATALAALDEGAFNAEMNTRSAGVFGDLALVGRRAIWPIVSQLADRLDGPRLALVAEAAHVMPPIGAQGLNTSLADIRSLRDLAVAAAGRGGDIGAPDVLTRYNRMRHAETVARVMGVDVLNRASMAGSQPLRDLRRAGLGALDRIGPLRDAAMRLGLGARGAARDG